MISNPNFIPPSFDESFHFKGMPKQKAQEKYNPKDYVFIGPRDPAMPSAQATGIFLTDGVPAAQYQEPALIECGAPAHTVIQMDQLDLGTNFSYDVELPREPQHSQDISPNIHPDFYRSSAATYLPHYTQAPSDGYYTPPEATPSHYSYPTGVPHITTNADLYPQQYPENHPAAVDDYFPPPPQPLVEPHHQPEYSEVLHHSQVSDPQSVPITPHSLDMPPQHDFFEEMGFGMPKPEPFQRPQYQPAQFQPFHHPDAHFNHSYHPALAAY
jgi:hypothetical protein